MAPGAPGRSPAWPCSVPQHAKATHPDRWRFAGAGLFPNEKQTPLARRRSGVLLRPAQQSLRFWRQDPYWKRRLAKRIVTAPARTGRWWREMVAPTRPFWTMQMVHQDTAAPEVRGRSGRVPSGGCQIRRGPGERFIVRACWRYSTKPGCGGAGHISASTIRFHVSTTPCEWVFAATNT